jgi:hypothetical protein
VAVYELPIDSADPAYDVDADMGGTLYRLAIAWNTRGKYWTLSISLTDGTLLVAGIRLVPDYELLARFNDARLPVGRLACVDLTGRGDPPTYEDLGTRVVMVYDDGLA